MPNCRARSVSSYQERPCLLLLSRSLSCEVGNKIASANRLANESCCSNVRIFLNVLGRIMKAGCDTIGLFLRQSCAHQKNQRNQTGRAGKSHECRAPCEIWNIAMLNTSKTEFHESQRATRCGQRPVPDSSNVYIRARFQHLHVFHCIDFGSRLATTACLIRRLLFQNEIALRERGDGRVSSLFLVETDVRIHV